MSLASRLGELLHGEEWAGDDARLAQRLREFLAAVSAERAMHALDAWRAQLADLRRVMAACETEEDPNE